MHRLIISMLVVLGHPSAGAQTPFPGVASTPLARFEFGDWSDASDVVVRTEAGSTLLPMRRCAVRVTSNRGGMDEVQIQSVWDSETRELWLGEESDTLVSMSGRLYGLTLSGGDLVVNRSQSAASIPGGERAVVETFLRRFLKDPDPASWLDPAIGSMRYRLDRVLGGNVMTPAPHRSSEDIRMTVARVLNNGVVLKVATAWGRSCEILLSSDQRIVAASVDGTGIPVLFDGVVPDVHTGQWGGGGIAPIDSAPDPMAVLPFSRSFPMKDALGEEIGSQVLRVAVSVPGGSLWRGPVNCQLVSLNGRLFGFRMGADENLEVVESTHVTIPMNENSVTVFRQHIRQFESEFVNNGLRIPPDRSWKVLDLLGEKARGIFNADSRFRCRKVAVREGAIRITLSASDVRGRFPEINLGPELQVLSVNVLRGYQELEEREL
ncbi:MAG: hypothetical protein KF833_08125 [Verrucomicrobiae bacterium]|nr:hypothetical protein [Verrucomicrobiae bacterium]